MRAWVLSVADVDIGGLADVVAADVAEVAEAVAAVKTAVAAADELCSGIGDSDVLSDLGY